jgi:hypothetical protein
MALETGTYISDLTITNPVSTDGIGQADDHLRLIKKTIKNSFTSITGAVTATQAELNVLDGITSTTAELNKLDGVTWDLTALNGLTSTVAEINKLDGFTGTVADLNYAADLNATGVTATEYDYLDGVTSNIQTQLSDLSTTKANLSGASFTGAVDVNASLTANSLVIDNGSNDWSFEITSNVLYFKYAGVSKAKLDTNGNLTVVGNITAYGTV